MFRMHYLLATFLSLVICSAYSQELPPTPIKSEQKTNGSDKSAQQKTESINHISKNPIQPNSEERSEEGTEFWRPIFGYRLKVTDTLVAAFTFLLFIATYFLYRATRDLVKGADATAEMQLRAYLTVVIGSATYQETGKDIRFAGRPRIINTGKTPAHNVRHKVKAAVLPVQLPDGFSFPLTQETVGGSVIGPGQVADIQGVVDDFFLDSEVSEIKCAKDRVLHIWGVIFYDDIFGNARETQFCQSLTWIGEGKNEIVYGYFNPKHNDAT